ncbi:probable terpene synthase 9 [Diospyros lotus]|uniref:probable terpene synthase 9 n=1 Tax=Diospyros lotus TaxID=55363 RepID=UPI002250B804|nr:probable terpene synthase 9 [Diospyros lotus]
MMNSTVHSNRYFKPKNEFQMNERRRSANYHPSIWDPKFVESLNTSYTYEIHGCKLEALKQQIRSLLKPTKEFEAPAQLKLVDSMQRLGMAYHFEEEIEETIGLVRGGGSSNLSIASLQFRLLREHGYPVSSAVFTKFKGSDGRFMESLSKEAEGLLSLYEASHYGVDGEHDLEEAKNFSLIHLKAFAKKDQGSKLGKQIQKSLEIPLRWRMTRLEARSFIDLYRVNSTENSLLLQFAKLDYNLVQSVHQKEVKDLIKWWLGTGLNAKLSFTRDRLMENYLWAMGIIFEPKFSKCRIGLTKFICILTAIDDMYDIYGSLDELQLFTDAVNRWDGKATDHLPDYMKICYLAMFNFGNEIARDALTEHGLNVIPFIKEEWANLCRSYLVEAQWFYNGYTPTLKEYLESGWNSVGGKAAIAHAYLLLGSAITRPSVDSFKACSDVVYWSSLIARLSNDLGTSKAEIMRGDAAKSIQCYMIEEGVSEEEAREHIKGLMGFSWRKLNEASARNNHAKSLVKMCLNMARTAQLIYLRGDGIGTSVGAIKDHLISLIVKPILIK